jgi:adenomatosis polyposis coli protein
LLSMLATRDQEDTARTLLAMSSSPESCVAMRRSGCLPLLLQILHGTEAGGRAGSPGAPGAKDARMRANAALHNIVFSQPDQGLARKEMRVLHVLEQIRAYCETCWDWLQARDSGPEGGGTGGGECAGCAGHLCAMGAQPGCPCDRAAASWPWTFSVPCPGL